MLLSFAKENKACAVETSAHRPSCFPEFMDVFTNFHPI